MPRCLYSLADIVCLNIYVYLALHIRPLIVSPDYLEGSLSSKVSTLLGVIIINP